MTIGCYEVNFLLFANDRHPGTHRISNARSLPGGNLVAGVDSHTYFTAKQLRFMWCYLCGFIVICCCFCCIIFYTQISDIEEIMSKVMYGGIVGSVNSNMNKYRN